MAQTYIMAALAQLGSGERDQPVAYLCKFSSPKYSAYIQYQVNIIQCAITITREPREFKINIFNGIQATPDSRTKKAVYEMFLERAGLEESHEFANSGGLQFHICIVFLYSSKNAGSQFHLLFCVLESRILLPFSLSWCQAHS